VSIHEVAAKFDNRPGYRVVDYGRVGLPVYRVTVIALTLLKKSLNPIEEFVLRAVGHGMANTSDIAGLLGLSPRVVDGAIAELVRSENIAVTKESDDVRLSLTEKGTLVVDQQEEIKPVEQTFPFTYDGLTRQPKWYDDSQLYTPRELKESGIEELRAFPARGPELHELDVRDVDEVLKLVAGKTETPTSLLKIISVERRQRLFNEAVALAYRSEDGEAIQIAFAIDGRTSELHERAFAEMKGLERNRIFRNLHHRPEHREVEEALGPELMQRASDRDVRRARSDAARAQAAMNQAKVELARAEGKSDQSEAREQVERAESDLAAAAQHSAIQEVRPIEVYEHADILRRAIDEANDRLLIISPWIRASVVTEEFLGRLEALLKRRVKLTIGYGLGETDPDEPRRDHEAKQALEALAARYENFLMKRLGDTHAKVLIKDRDFFVISSFNWLSFKGDRKRTFREELGTLVMIPERVDELFDRVSARFADDGGGGSP